MSLCSNFALAPALHFGEQEGGRKARTTANSTVCHVRIATTGIEQKWRPISKLRLLKAKIESEIAARTFSDLRGVDKHARFANRRNS